MNERDERDIREAGREVDSFGRLDIVTSDTSHWKLLRDAAQLLEEAENRLEILDLPEAFGAYARDIRTIEIELLRMAVDLQESENDTNRQTH